MRKGGPNTDEVDALVDAVCMVLNDMGDDDLSVCAYVKAKLRVAFEPFELDDNGDLMDLERAREIVKSNEAKHGAAV